MPDPDRRRARSRLLVAMLAGLAGLAIFLTCGVYSIQPIGALPDGATLIVRRETGEPFFNSADALCLERMGGVSLLCRGLALSKGPHDRILVKLPYQDWAYGLSTGGRSFDR